MLYEHMTLSPTDCFRTHLATLMKWCVGQTSSKFLEGALTCYDIRATWYVSGT